MTVHITTRVSPSKHAVVTLRGRADEGLLTMIADGIASLIGPRQRLTVDLTDLELEASGDLHATLHRLLGERSSGGVVELRSATATSTARRAALVHAFAS